MWFNNKQKDQTTTTRERGQAVEQLAEQFLQQQGLKSITRNYQIKGGEIDLIMHEGDVLVFVEVRYRKDESHGSGAESITWRKQQRLNRAARHYLQKHYGNREPDCRFDVISASGYPVTFEWITNAFQ